MDLTRNNHHTFRIDDVSVNTDADKLLQMISFLRQRFLKRRILLAVSCMTHHMEHESSRLNRERVYPAELNRESDFRCFYDVDRCQIPPVVQQLALDPDIAIASHGIVHVDHRLLRRSAQELSILLSCSLLKCSIFVPPFHKWNHKTSAICDEHGIELIRLNDSWAHLKYHNFNPLVENHYLHTHDFSYEDFCKKFP